MFRRIGFHLGPASSSLNIGLRMGSNQNRISSMTLGWRALIQKPTTMKKNPNSGESLPGRGKMRGIGGPLLCIGDLLSDVGELETDGHRLSRDGTPLFASPSPSFSSSSTPSISSKPLDLQPADLTELFQETYGELNKALDELSSHHSWTSLTLKLCTILDAASKLIKSAGTSVMMLSDKVSELERIIKRGDSCIAAVQSIHGSLSRKGNPFPTSP